MPATQNYRLADWHEHPFLSGVHDLNNVPDSRVTDIDNPQEVAACLLETDDQIEAYRWSLSEEQLSQLALESAKAIIENRNQLLLERQLQMRFEAAKAKPSINLNGRRLAAVVSLVQNQQTGESHITERYVEPSRINA